MSNKEQLSLVLRYIDMDTLVREDFECRNGISGRDLAELITSTLQAYGLDLSYLWARRTVEQETWLVL